MPPLVIFVDDKQSEAEDLIKRLNATGLLSVQYFAPTENLDISSLPEDIKLLLVDWELNTQQDDGKKVSYLGATFSTRFREVKPNTPIILSTKKDIFGRNIRLSTDNGIFDGKMFKEEIKEDPEEAAKKCLIWIEGYEKLTEVDKNLTGIFDLLSATEEDDLAAIGNANLPLTTKSADTHTSVWEIVSMARWINEVFLEYPGFIYDNLHAATFLGISLESFESILPELEALKYTGAFAPSQGRWWKSKLQKFAQEIIAEANMNTVSIQHNFQKAFEQKFKTKISYSQCVYSKQSPADWVCYLLKKPVMLRYSLSYYPDNRPLAMDEARVSFTAIKEDHRNLFYEYFNVSDKEALNIIKELSEHET
jgi:hypothetical protein